MTAERRDALLEIIFAGKPMTVRQVFYQATVRGLVEKAESGYAKVQTDLTIMRRAGELPYDWLADNTRWQRKPRTFDSVEDALRETAAFYRKSLWADADCYVEVWLEKDALSGVPTRPTKKSDTRSKSFGEISVELDAIDPNQLRAIVQAAIEQHLPRKQFEILKAAEQSEREIISRLMRRATS